MNAWIPFEAIVATSHRVEKYGGVALSTEALQQIVDALNSGSLPMIGQHDWTKPIRTKDVDAQMVALDDGENAVRLTGLVHESDWDSIGAVGGLSFTTMETIGRADGPHPERDAIALSADAGWFDDETIGAACSIISQVAPVDGKRLLQFSAVDLARIVLEIGYSSVIAMGPGLATNAIWDGIKYLLLRRKPRERAEHAPSRIEMRTDLDSGEVVGIIDTADPELARDALKAYSQAVESVARAPARDRTVIVWKPEDGEGVWVALERPER